MAKQGTVVRIAENGTYGFIKQDDGGPDVYFRSQWLRDASATVGLRVEYETQEAPQGLQTRWVKAIGRSQTNITPKPSSDMYTQHVPTAPQAGNDYRFLNPYNFVRYLKIRPQGNVLGDCPPPPHDRYVGLTGHITCIVEAATPLFISDSHDIQVDPEGEKDHKIYRFFEYEGQPALPASSLRGMVRSVYEAVTNSCFSIFQKDEENKKIDRLEYRVTSDPGLLPARVLKIEPDKVVLEIFDCTTMSPPVPCKDHPITVKSGMVSAYLPKVLRRGPNNTEIPFDKRGVVTQDWHDGDRVAALVSTSRKVKTKTIHGEEKRLYQWFEVVALAPIDNCAHLVAKSGQRRVFGYLHVTGPNIENKHDERLFFRWDDQDPEACKTYKPETIELDIEVVYEYNRMISKYWERRSSKNDSQALPSPSTFVQIDNVLKPDDLVYCFADDWQQAHLCPVSMPRLPYRFARERLLPKHSLTCHPETEKWESLCLCPACRTFGWVHANPPKNQPDLLTAYAGRLHFSHGALAEGQDLAKLRLPDTPLAILGSPKPTTTQFYLHKDPGNGQLRPDSNVDYNNESARLRGRKFYRHQDKAKPEEYKRATDEKHKGKDDQNRTVRGALGPGAKFTFTVDFENLAREELGALLWSLELEPGMYHRLGFAKPLGFGSVKLTVTEVSFLLPEQRYKSESLGETSGWASYLSDLGKEKVADSDKRKIGDIIADFKKALQDIYKQPFSDLLNVRDLSALLRQPPDLPIHYPRSSEVADPEGKNFEWFMENKRRRPPLTLPLAEDEGECKAAAGLPLLRKR